MPQPCIVSKTSVKYARAPGCVVSSAYRSWPQLKLASPGLPGSPTSHSGCSSAVRERAPTKNGATQRPARRPVPGGAAGYVSVSARLDRQQPFAVVGILRDLRLRAVADDPPPGAGRAQGPLADAIGGGGAPRLPAVLVDAGGARVDRQLCDRVV